MLFSVATLIPAVIFWYDNIKICKKLELLKECSLYHKENNLEYLITNVNINSLVKKPLIAPWSSKKWLSLCTETYRRIKVVKSNYFYHFKNKTYVYNKYIKTNTYNLILNTVNGVDINPLMETLLKFYEVREPQVIIDNNMPYEEIDNITIDGSITVNKYLGYAYYNSGICYNTKETNKRCTIIGKIDTETCAKTCTEKYDIKENTRKINTNNVIVFLQNKLNLDEIRDSYINTIKSNNRWFTAFVAIALIMVFVESRKKMF